MQGVQQFVRHGGNGAQARGFASRTETKPSQLPCSTQNKCDARGPAHFQLDCERVNYFS